MTSKSVENQSNKNVKMPVNPVKNSGGKVVLTLYTGLLPESAFKETPSQADGLDIETETDLRICGCEMIQTAGILLRLPQVAMATGQIYLQKFYYCKSFVRYPVEIMAMGSIYLASKVEEKPCGIRDVINVFHHIKQVRAQKIISPLIVDQKYTDLHNQVIKAERYILKEFGFCVNVKHPYKLIVVYLQILQYEKNHQLMQLAWNYMNDALRTNVYLRFTPETIVCACIYLSACKVGLPLPNNPHWFLLFMVTEEDIKEVCICILQLYKRSKVNPEELESKLDGLRKIYQTGKHIQYQKEPENTESQDKKVLTPKATTSREANRRDSTKEKSPKTPPLSSKYHSSYKSKKEKRSRSPYNLKQEYSSKRYKSRSRDSELDRSRERRQDEKRGRFISRKYEYYDRSKSSRYSRDEKRKR